MADRLEINGARTLLTGASGGIGGALARRLAQEGAKLILTGRRKDVLDSLARELGAEVIVSDLSLAGAPQQLLARAGRVDILIANAVLPATGRLATVDPARIDSALAVNLLAPIALARGVITQMAERDSGHIVFIGSLQSKAATGGASIYCATKFGLRGFSLALRAELARTGVGVSLVLPGFVSDAGMYADSRVKLPRGVGTRRPEQVAAAVIRAIRGNVGEIEVAPLTLRAGAAIASLAPELSARGMRLLGGDRIARDFERAQSDKR
ncbi:MAG TPA: SDR family NAD(P)-dependent oxidoreductase [Solirubrobacteraceae bacterium]|nr:SDR family NAD(P)-dependent oxidoreductase [Solirubrobacteraceae bacterium]